MNNTVTIILVLLYCFAQFSPPVSAAVSEKHPNPNRKFQTCYHPSTGYLKPGEIVAIPGECTNVICAKYGIIFFDRCAATSWRHDLENCVQIMNLRKPFPYCCHYLRCHLRGSQETIPKSPIPLSHSSL